MLIFTKFHYYLFMFYVKLYLRRRVFFYESEGTMLYVKVSKSSEWYKFKEALIERSVNWSREIFAVDLYIGCTF